MDLCLHVRRPNAVEINSPYGDENTGTGKPRPTDSESSDPETPTGLVQR